MSSQPLEDSYYLNQRIPCQIYRKKWLPFELLKYFLNSYHSLYPKMK